MSEAGDADRQHLAEAVEAESDALAERIYEVITSSNCEASEFNILTALVALALVTATVIAQSPNLRINRTNRVLFRGYLAKLLKEF